MYSIISTKDRRQAYGVDQRTGMEYNAESWSPGRTVARIPLVVGNDTHRSGQGAWLLLSWRQNVQSYRKVNLDQRRHALPSEVAASAVISLVLARGYRINQIPEIPLVVDSLQVSKIKELLKILKTS